MISNTDVKVKVWEDGTSEPGTWDLTATDSGMTQLPAGSAGLYFFAPSGVASPDIQVDDYAGLVHSDYTAKDDATTLDPPDKLTVPKDHLAMAVLKNGSDTRPGMVYCFQYDGVGNRTDACKRSGHGSGEDYTANLLNQMTDRDNPGVVHVSGYASEDATVLVNDQPAHRDGAYYYAVVEVSNTSGPVVKEITVCVIEKSADEETTTETTYKAIVGKSAETSSEIDYDDRGNLLSDSVHDYAWDLMDRLTEVVTNSNITDDDAKVKLEFEYDALSRRTKKKVYSWDPVGEDWQLDETIRFVWDGWLLIAEVDESDELIRSYIWGLDKSGSLQGAGGVGGLLAVVDHTGMSPETYWTACNDNDNGNVMALVKASDQSVAASYEYSPYGELLSADGDYAENNPLRFSTKYYDGEIGLYYYGYRYYSPSTGRWLNRDPIAEDGGLNLYAFVSNDPLNSSDSTGLKDYKKGTSDPVITHDIGAGKWNSESLTPTTVVFDQALRRLEFKVAAGIAIGHDAVAHLNHYLKNTGDAYNIDLKGMVDEAPDAKLLFDEELELAKEFAETLSPGKHDITSDTPSEGYNTQDESKNWFFAVGGYSAWGKGKVSVKLIDASRQVYEYDLEFTYKFEDRYNWDTGKSVTIPRTKIVITDEFMGKLHKQGLAKEFKMKGKIIKRYTWRRARTPGANRHAVPLAPAKTQPGKRETRAPRESQVLPSEPPTSFGPYPSDWPGATKWDQGV